jgi:dipeptidyl aminopeptidase/acylaminoacyl peptidase
MNRILRLFIFVVFTVAVAYIAIDLGLAWIMVSGMTHPGCRAQQALDQLRLPEEHWLNTEDGISIRIWYYPSQNGAAILAFGGMAGSLGNQLPPVAPLIRAGYGVVQVDNRNCARPSAPVTLGGNELYDAEAALEFLLSRPEIDPDRIGAFGFSMGGATAIRVAARHPQIQSVVRDGGFSNLGDLLSPKNTQSFPARIYQSTVWMLFLNRSGIDPWKVSPMDDLASISPRPVLLIYGELEAEAGIEQSGAGDETVELWIVPGGTHGQNHILAPVEFEGRVLNFFEQTLSK